MVTLKMVAQVDGSCVQHRGPWSKLKASLSCNDCLYYEEGGIIKAAVHIEG